MPKPGTMLGEVQLGIGRLRAAIARANERASDESPSAGGDASAPVTRFHATYIGGHPDHLKPHTMKDWPNAWLAVDSTAVSYDKGETHIRIPVDVITDVSTFAGSGNARGGPMWGAGDKVIALSFPSGDGSNTTVFFKFEAIAERSKRHHLAELYSAIQSARARQE